MKMILSGMLVQLVGRLRALARTLRWKISGEQISWQARIAAEGVIWGKNVYIGPQCRLSVRGGGRITIGDNVRLEPFVQISTFGGDVHIGNNVIVGEFSVLYGHGGLRIGNDVLIATHTVFIPANHHCDKTDCLIRLQGESRQGIRVGDDCWIGTHAVILDGVSIGDHAVVGAGSVVTHSVGAAEVVAGNPARLIRKRGGQG
ncbi:MAG TPA: acyltransferase [Candidatus Omnitrophota bacterium]|nr:acyltransferase [Candidatus Omnitrophota bacterium]HRZ14509.1 acyltransferase [Candidatus Omnitrophota bacterium]